MQTDFEIADEVEVLLPKMYKVLLHNDDYSTFDFVIKILMEIFNKSQEEAQSLTIEVDKEGYAVVGIYPKEIAETKVLLVTQSAKQAGFPLLATMEEA
ncbi:MAG: ATP-dependent Clp protease adaptor ClpS [Epsilonproteobacteria bacterium]|nr:ATP-dependent Clp protease adaptor ClpS [Campylobacterota bacterium]